MELTESDYRLLWNALPKENINPTVSIRVLTPDGKEGYADLTRGIFVPISMSKEEFLGHVGFWLKRMDRL